MRRPVRVGRRIVSATLSAFALALAACETPTAGSQAARSPVVAFERHVLSHEFFGEGAAFADLDRDGHADIVSGPYWYGGPDFGERHEIFEPKAFDPAGYSDAFFAFPYDVDGDGWLDVLAVGFPGEAAAWFENPRGAGRRWERHLACAAVDNESPAFTDLTGDGRPELLFHTSGRLGWAAPDPRDVRAPWPFHALSEDLGYDRFTHGLGVGDLDGDGRADVLTRDGWWRQPQSLAGDPAWERHAFAFAAAGGAQMLVTDVDGDGDADVISSLAAHGFGLSWFEQRLHEGAITFVEHPILRADGEENAQGVTFAELHALALADIDGDGLPDLVTGKRFWSHGARGDPELGAPATLAWFQLVRGPDGVEWVAHVIDRDSGVGTQVVAGDVDGDARSDVVVGNKNGTFVFLQRDEAPAPATPHLDLERGDLSGWHATGTAFARQPVYGDTPAGRQREPSRHAGRFWIGGYERLGDGPTGTLTSDPFAVTAPFGSFLVGGGAGSGERVELLDEGATEPFFATSGANTESLQRVVVDLASRAGRRIVVRLVDEESGGWGHVNFDDFLFHAVRPEFPRDPAVPPILAWDAKQAAGLPPADAARAMTLPDGLRVDVIAAEPDLHQPIALAIDVKGRLWVAEAFSYPAKRAPDAGHDDIVVFEDRDHDGAFETRSVFAAGLDLVSGLELGHGGAWVGQAPELLFFPDRNDDLVPDGPPEVVLDGFGFQDTHETLNAFTWGPDGWLYGCHGVFTHSRVGAPGTPDAQRVPLNAGIWRLHPRTRAFEVFAWGTSNPWGLDFDARGQAFATACVIPHLFHVIQGARYQRQAGEHFGRFVFDDIKTIADHLHYLGDDPWQANGRSDAVGGGHAHCGALLCLGAGLPERLRGALLMGNVHGNRVNVDRLERSGSGFVGRHAQDFLRANDAWFRAISLRAGPDGSVYLIDWYDKEPCHLTREDRWDRTNGRLYRVTSAGGAPVAVDLRVRTNAELLALQTEPDEWFARGAQLVLAERGPAEDVRAALEQRFAGAPDDRSRLRALWTLHASGNLTEEILLAGLRSDREDVTAWCVQLACESRAPSAAVAGECARLAAESGSPVVRLYLASALQRLPASAARAVAEPLALHGEDGDDANIPLVLWYGLEPLVGADPAFGLRLARSTPLALIERFIVRRLAADSATREALVAELSRETDPARRLRWLGELRLALADESSLPMPPSWPALQAGLHGSADPAARDAASALASIFGDAQAGPELRALLADGAAAPERRRGALTALAHGADAASVPAVLAALDEPALRRDALAALAAFDDARITPAVLAHYAGLSADERAVALTTLAARPEPARALLAAVADGRVPRADLSAYVLRTLLDSRDPEVARLLEEDLGIVRSTGDERLARIASLKQDLAAGVLAGADRAHGRALYEASCARCHALFGSGGALAPDLTGSNRRDLDYLLTNMVDPSAVIPDDYRARLVWSHDGRLVTGIVRRRTESTLVLGTETGEIVVEQRDIDEERLSDISTMPEGLLDALQPADIADLVAYLQGDAQAERPATAPLQLFDGRTLAGWTGDAGVWSVEDGAIVGRTAGLQRNAFLVSDIELADFRLAVEVRLAGDAGNSGIQFRSRPAGDGEVAGPQADIGPGWWGKLYEEGGRGVLWDRSGEAAVVKDGWNRYEIVAVGGRIRTAINGVACVDLEDGALSRSGRIALQVHSGVATEVRFRIFALELDPHDVPTTPAPAR